jgi:Fic family protein
MNIMQRPPSRKTPPILFTRGTSEWLSRVNQNHKQLTELRLSAEQKERLDRWAETEFIYSTLNLEGASINREQVARVVLQGTGADANAESQRTTMALLDSLRTATSLARAKGKAAELTNELLLKLHSPPGAGFRKTAGDTNRIVRPAPAEHLPALLESACRWYTAESFAELNPLEQASIVLLRLIEIQPFEEANERTALVAASLFTLRSGLPPIIIKPEMDSAYRKARDEGMQMNTKPMVELVAEAVERSLSEMIAQAGKQT